MNELKKAAKALSKAAEALEKVAETSNNVSAYECIMSRCKYTEPDRIYVPENIKFDYYTKDCAIISENRKMSLMASGSYGGIPVIELAGNGFNKEEFLYKGRPYLQKCNREELKQGDVAYFTNKGTLENIGELSQYGVILNNEEHSLWSLNDMVTMHKDSFMNWYKVIFE